MIFLIRRFLYFSILVFWIAVLVFSTRLVSQAATQTSVPSSKTFPVFKEIEPNVDFWIDIFTKYSKAQGVLHDARDLSRVYKVIQLNPDNTRKAAKENQKTKKKAIKKYKAILLKLAQGHAPASAKEKKTAALFGSVPKASTLGQAALNLRIQTGLKDQFKEGLVRSGALIDEFKRIFLSHGLPQDLAFLPCVESSFNVNAYSKFGAAGIWQFTRSTGKRYMEIGYVVDQRRDPYISTQGAANLLKRNYSVLKNWPMALTAYNHGLNGMKRAKKKHQTYPRIYSDYKSRSFKFASRNFYSEFLAARQVAKHPSQYFKDLTPAKPVSHTLFKVQGFVPAKDLAKGLGLGINEIKQLNPALRKPVFDNRKYIPKGYELRLPQGIASQAVARAAAPLYKDRQKPSKFHRVQKGDTAGRIARTHKVGLNDLILANDLGRRATIYIGQTLRIPSRGEIVPLKTALAQAHPEKKEIITVSHAPPKADKTSRQPRPAPIKTVKTVPKKAVVPKDLTLEKQPQAILPPEAEIQAKPAITATQVNLKIVTSDLKIQKTIQKNNRLIGVIHVAAEETLGHYADWLSIATQTIRNLNRLPFGRAITIGQAIKIPLPETGSKDFEEQRYEFHQEILEDFFDSYFVASTQVYDIKSGDTLWFLCVNQLEIPLWLLEKYNPAINLARLKPGQQLTYPLVSPNGIHGDKNGEIHGL